MSTGHPIRRPVYTLCLYACCHFGCVRLFATPWNPGVGCRALLQGIFPTQGLNSRLLHCRQIPYLLSHWGSPLICIHNLILTEHLPPASAGSSVGEKSSSGGQDPEEDDADGKGTRTAGRKSRGARSPRAKGTLRRRAHPCQTLRGRTPVPTRWANRGDADPGPRGFSGVTGAEMRPQWVRGDLEMGGRGATAA